MLKRDECLQARTPPIPLVQGSSHDIHITSSRGRPFHQAGGAAAWKVYEMKNLVSVDDHGLFMHLQLAVARVYGAREAMWEELKTKVARGDRTLLKYGWKLSDYSEGISRKKFNALWERFRA